jgi:hypothetical protein
MRFTRCKEILSRHRKLRFNLVGQLIVFAVIAVLSAGGSVSLVMMRHSENSLRRQIIADNLAIVDLGAQLTARYVQESQWNLEFFARSPDIVRAAESGDFKQTTPHLQDFLKINPRLDGCALFDALGFNRASGRVDPPDIGGVRN